MDSSPKSSLPRLDRLILNIVRRSEQRLSFGKLFCLSADVCPRVSKNGIKRSVRRLISMGELCYTNVFGSSWIEYNYNRPLALTNRFWLIPAGFSPRPEEDKVPIILARGAAFGLGDHPTTRLSLRGLDWLSVKMGFSGFASLGWQVLDIGTGSGILAIAAAKLGCRYVWAFDVDGCARHEARVNVELNGLGDKVAVGACWKNSKSGYQLVMANLRLPTIARYSEKIKSNTTRNSFLLFSGIRPKEGACLDEIFSPLRFDPVLSANDLGWSMRLYQRRD